MRNTLVVRSGQSVGQLHRQLHSFARGQALRRDALPQRLAFNQFGHDVVNFVGYADVENGNDVGMVEGSDRSRLLLKSP
jgi:hypothetical protein